jgi:hypothetical protein
MRQSREEDDDDVGREIGLAVDVVRNYGKRLTQFSGTRAGAGCAFVLSPTHFQTWYIHHINLEPLVKNIRADRLLTY